MAVRPCASPLRCCLARRQGAYSQVMGGKAAMGRRARVRAAIKFSAAPLVLIVGLIGCASLAPGHPPTETRTTAPAPGSPASAPDPSFIAPEAVEFALRAVQPDLAVAAYEDR